MDPLRIDILTLFPGILDGFLDESIVKRAIERKFLAIHRWNLRDHAEGKHQQMDDRPYGGGPGMVLMAPPVVQAVEAVQASGPRPGRLVLLTPQGRRFDQAMARELAAESRLLLLCGRYEGFDQRISELLNPDQVSIGDYVLSGGEVPAMVVIEAVMRLIPGVVGDLASTVDESFGSAGGLEYPHYTRPRDFRGCLVPDVLLSGDHEAVARWRESQRRPLPQQVPTSSPQASSRPESEERPCRTS